MTTTSTSANGTADHAGKPEPIKGIARVRAAEAYHLASMADDATFEADRLTSEINRAMSGAYLRDAHVSDAAEAISSPAMRDKINDAIQCLQAAEQHLASLADIAPPF